MLWGLRERLLAPEIVAEFVCAFAAEIAEADRQLSGMRSQVDAQIVDIDRRLEGVLRAIEKGAWSGAPHKRLGEIETAGRPCNSKKRP